MNNYNLYTDTEQRKYEIITIIRAAGAKITGVSACGSGYYIQLDATEKQTSIINKVLEGVN